MPTPATWQELTQRNIATIKDIFEKAGFRPDLDRRIHVMDIAVTMIKDERFDSVSARWNAFHNALRILVEGLSV